MPDVPNNRDGPQARESSKCLNGRSYGERLAKEAFWSPAAWGLKNDSDRDITPVAEAVPAHVVLPQSQRPRQLHHLHAQPSVGQSCYRPKKKKKSLVSIYAGLLQSCPTPCYTMNCGLVGFSVRGFLQARILESIGQYWLPYPSRALYFLLP